MIDARTLQRFLVAAGGYAFAVDGEWGDQSERSARYVVAANSPLYAPTWTDDRCRTAVEQLLLRSEGFYAGTIDGIAGPVMQVGVEKWQDHITFVRPSPNPSAGVREAVSWPRQQDMVAFYGRPGNNHTRITLPYPIYYDGDRVSSIEINRKCAASASRIYAAVLKHYGAKTIHDLGLDRYGGCFANRTMRNGQSLSTHAVAAAIDWDPERNQLRQNHRTARFARPEYAAFIDAHEAEGWISLGRARDMDWMHFQAVRF